MRYQQPYGVSDPAAPYINGDPSIGQQGSIPPAAAFEHHQRELVSLIEKSLYTPTNSDLLQVLRSVRSQWINFAIDTGSANALSVALNPPLENYRQGFPLRVRVATSNTGATTINVDGLGARTLVRPDGSALQASDVVGGMIANLVDTGTSFQLLNALHGTAATTNVFTVNIPYVADASAVSNTITAPFSPAITTISEGAFIAVKVANLVTGITNITVNALAPLRVRRTNGDDLGYADILAGETVLMVHHGTYYQLLTKIPARRVLTADYDVYVNSATGNDNNSGLDAGHPFATINRGVAVICDTLDLNGFTATVHVADGSYGGVTLRRGVGSGRMQVIGNTTTPAACVISTNTQPGSIQLYEEGTAWVVRGFRLFNSYSPPGGPNGNGIYCLGGTILNWKDISFGTCTWGHVTVIDGGYVYCDGSYSVDGSAYAHYISHANGVIDTTAMATLTITGNPTFTGFFAYAQDGGIIYPRYTTLTIVGTCTGQRYYANLNGVVDTYLGGASYLPGTIAGSTAQGGQYR